MKRNFVAMSGLSQKRRTTQPTSVTTVKGQDGAPGSKIYRDSGAPIDSLGNNGDYYINQTTGQYYGPKAAGTWSGVGPYDFVTSEAITGQTGATPTTGDFFLFSDTSDSGTLKKVDASVLLSGGGSFDGLSDTPANKTGHALKVIRVNAGETALEYVTLSGGGDMLKSTYDTNDDGTVNDSDNLGGNSSAWHLDRANHGGTQTAATISDFDTEVSNNTDVADNTSKAHTQGSDLALDTGNANEVTAADLRDHLDDADKHREINDAGTGATELWSASKINSELTGKSDTGHTHAAGDIDSGNLSLLRLPLFQYSAAASLSLAGYYQVPGAASSASVNVSSTFLGHRFFLDLSKGPSTASATMTGAPASSEIITYPGGNVTVATTHNFDSSDRGTYMIFVHDAGSIWQMHITPIYKPRTKTLAMVVEAPGTDPHTTGNNIGSIGLDIPEEYNGWRVTGGFVRVQEAGITGTENYVIPRVRAGVSTDVITALNIASTETRVEGGTVSTASSNDIVATGDLFPLDRDAVQTTPAKGWTMYGIYLSEY